MNPILLIVYIYAFVVGMCIASFVNVVIYRVPRRISVAKGRSFCPSCKHQLGVLDLIPIFSYLFLGGKCRYCDAKIPVRDTLVEILGGCLAMLCFLVFGFSWMTLLSFTFGMVLIAIAMIDLDTMTIPDELNICVLLIAIASMFITDISLVDRLIGVFIVSVPLWAINFVVADSFGGGDIKLLAACGLLLGWKYLLVGAFIAILLAGSYAIYLVLSKKVERKDHIAFGPYICFGMFVVLLYGEQILEAYLHFFGL